MATSSASRRSSIRVSFRNRSTVRIRSRAALYSSSSLACSGQEIARAKGEHMGAPVENVEGESSRMAKQKQILFSLFFCHSGATVRQGRRSFLKHVSTIGLEGSPQHTLIGIAVTPELEIVFDTVERSRKSQTSGGTRKSRWSPGGRAK